MKAIRSLSITAALLVGAANAQAALEDRGGGMIYDSTLNITWLADMNYAKTSGYDADGFMGSMTWPAATQWADQLVYGGYDDWRLPTLNSADEGGCYANGYSCAHGELSHLFVVDLGNKRGETVLDQTGDTAEQMANLALFSNLDWWRNYWSGSVYNSPGYPMLFRVWDGTQAHTGYNSSLDANAVAVRSGDVAAVPEPQTLALWLLGLGVTLLASKRRKA